MAKRWRAALAAAACIELALSGAACAGEDAQGERMAREIHARISAEMLAADVGAKAARFEVGSAQSWPAEAESFAYELTGPRGDAKVVVLDSWARSATADELAFVIGHEMAHAACQHRFKTIGLYSERSQAVGADAELLGMGADSDMGFAFSTQAASRAMEKEADAVGAAMARQAGYDWAAGAQGAVGHDAGSGSHPPGVDRLASVREKLSRPVDLRGMLLLCAMREPGAY